MNSVTASSNTTMVQITEMPQRKKTRSINKVYMVKREVDEMSWITISLRVHSCVFILLPLRIVQDNDEA